MVSPEEVSQMFDISKGTLANWRSRLQGPKFYKVKKRKILYALNDVEDFFKANPVMTSDSIKN
jgi:hypothetical protein